MLPLIIVFLGFYFLAIRPLQKKYGSEEVDSNEYHYKKEDELARKRRLGAAGVPPYDDIYGFKRNDH